MKKTFYFLGLVVSKNIVRGNIVPDYILSSFATMTLAYAPWRVVRRGKLRESMPRVLATSLSGKQNDMMIDFMSRYRTRVDTRSYRKEHPQGALFWFECDINGNRIENGAAVYIKHVPDKTIKERDAGWARMQKALLKTYTIEEALTLQKESILLETSGVKPLLMQGTSHNENEIKHYKNLIKQINKRRFVYGKKSDEKDRRRNRKRRSCSKEGDESDE